MSEHEIQMVLALARAWCHAAHLDEASAMLRPLVPGTPPPPDPARLRRVAGLGKNAPLPLVLSALAERVAPAPAASRLSRAADAAWDAILP